MTISATALLGTLTAVPAMANTSAHSIAPTGAGTATFQPYGEHLYIYDNKADGMSVVVLNWREDLEGYSISYEGWNASGAGTVKDYNLNMPEGDWIAFEVCLGWHLIDEIDWNTCGPQVVAYA